MDILLLLIPVSLLLLSVGGVLFWWTVNSGQYDDLDSPARRILFDDDSDMVPGRHQKSDSAIDSPNTEREAKADQQGSTGS
ncbi:cbb3-type cytochrome oxidase assembly protein CcoS [Saccharospirillum impatiens]|uniref:cbb3-type cytochrome oxidase assembly protein CcoS n=1 Tax=Saccharospirillum impatiens TaxID=169438 RepID=UPI0004269697|nr:cbb3-type cytochrome oxidase assembly protein CcoS [Saccharospirillum impatiens]